MALFFAANILWFADDVVSSTDAKQQKAVHAERTPLAADREPRLGQVVR